VAHGGPEYAGSRANIAAQPRPDYPGSRADILAGARAEVSQGSRAGQRMESPNRRRESPHRAGRRHQSPAGLIPDQFSRIARHESPGRKSRPADQPAQGLPRAGRSDVSHRGRSKDDLAIKPMMLSSSDIILRPAVPPFSDQKPRKLSFCIEGMKVDSSDWIWYEMMGLGLG